MSNQATLKWQRDKHGDEEFDLIDATLQLTKGNVRHAAELLCVSYNELTKLINRKHPQLKGRHKPMSGPRPRRTKSQIG